MTIDSCFAFCQYVANKEQKGIIKPADFNRMAIQAQLEVIMNCLGNQKRLNDRYLPPTGYKVNQQMKEQIMSLIVKSSVLVPASGIAPYPDNYFGYDNLQREDGTPITILESDQLGRIKKSVITPPIEEEPFACLHSEGIELAPADLDDAYLYYVKRPENPNWDYTIQNQAYVYNSTATPQLSGSVSHDFEVSERLHKDICMIILRYIGVNLSDYQLTEFANQVQERNP